MLLLFLVAVHLDHVLNILWGGLDLLPAGQFILLQLLDNRLKLDNIFGDSSSSENISRVSSTILVFLVFVSFLNLQTITIQESC